MTENSQSMTMLISEFGNNSTNVSEQISTYPLTKIEKKVTQKLNLLGILHILIGIIIIGLDISLLINDELSFLTGIFNGLYMIFVGIIILIECRGQVYRLTNLFTIVVFQFFFLAFTIPAYFRLIASKGRSCRYTFYTDCQQQTSLKAMIISGLIFILITLCLSIYTLIVIINGRRPPKSSVRATYSN